MIDSKLAKFAAVTAVWTDEVNSEVEEAIGILKSQGMNHMWWAGRLAHNMMADEGPTYNAANGGDDAATLLEIAFWSGWLKGEHDALERLMKVVAMFMTGDSPGENGNGKNDFLEGLL